MAFRTRLLRRAFWTSVLCLLMLGSTSMLAFLWPPAAKVQPGAMLGSERIDYHTGLQEATDARLSLDGREWEGTTTDFPSGSMTRFRPAASPSFFVVRQADDAWRVIADRSPYRGLRIKW